MITNVSRHFGRPGRALAALAAAATLTVCGLAAPTAAAQEPDEPQATSPTNANRAPDGLSYLHQSLLRDSDAPGKYEVTLVWSKPNNYRALTDYAIYATGSRDGRIVEPQHRIGFAGQNSASPAQRAFGTFYGDPSNRHAVQVQSHNFIATGLAAGTDYRFEVVGVSQHGRRVRLGARYATDLATPAAGARTFTVTADGFDGTPGVRSAADHGARVYTAAIQKAIDEAQTFASQHPDQGAEVQIPKGQDLLSGALVINGSHLTFRVDGTLRASLDLAQFTPGGTKFTPTNAEKYLDLIQVIGNKPPRRLQDVRIVGTGTIDGQGWKYRTDGAPNVPYATDLGLTESKEATYQTVADNGLLAGAVYRSCVAAGGPAGNSDCYKKRPNLIEGEQIDGMFIGGGLRLQNPANTLTGFKYFSDYVVDGIVAQTFNGNNGDSINVARFKGFTALNNVINSGDDNIVMNAGNESEYDADPVGSVAGSAWVFDNFLARGHGGVAFGSGTTSWIDNVLIEDNVFAGTSDGVRMKSKPGSGGGVRFVTVRDLAMKDLTNLVDGKVDPLVLGYQMDGAAFIFTTHYPGNYAGVKWPVFHNIDVSHVSVDGATTAGIIVDGIHDDALLQQAGIGYLPSNHINFRDVHFTGTGVPQIDGLVDSSFADVTFADSTGHKINNPWTSIADVDNVIADGDQLARRSHTFPITAHADRHRQSLRLTTAASFERFYLNTLPEDALSRVGTISVDGTPINPDWYPSFAPKAENFAVINGSDHYLAIAPSDNVNVGTTVVLKKPLMDSLPAGRHKITIRYQNATASGTFKITKR